MTLAKTSGHPCWKVQRALDDAGIAYAVLEQPIRKPKRTELAERSGERLLPAIEFEDGRILREDSADVVKTFFGFSRLVRVCKLTLCSTFCATACRMAKSLHVRLDDSSAAADCTISQHPDVRLPLAGTRETLDHSRQTAPTTTITRLAELHQTMNYNDTLIEVADDCPATEAPVPHARGAKKTKPSTKRPS